uniref:Copper transport protein n=1 Tax=Cacopsylla melanoneura TaxID=428564 RepID=A0A8D8UTW2_9HEMI
MDHSMHNHHDMHNHDHQQEVIPSLDSSIPLSSSVGHDHSTMDHEGHGGMMSMAFHWGCNEVILFNQWKISTPSGLIASMFGIFLFATLYEGVKYYREYLFWKTYNELHYRSIPAQQRGASSIEENKDTAKVVPVAKQPPALLMMSMPHFIQTLLHVLQVTMSFLLMLVFMTYNVALCIAVVAGAACGYFLFGWKKSVMVDVTEHCH